MRIISGTFRGKKLQAPPASPAGDKTRPTSDRTRQAVFNVLEHRYHLKYEGLKVLDAFAGTGALGIEALSRGAAFGTFIESSPAILPILKANLQSFPDRFEILKGEIQHQTLKEHSYGLVFLDPPYHQGLVEVALQILKKWNAISAEALIVTEMAKEETAPPSLPILSEHAYGGTKVLIGHLS